MSLRVRVTGYGLRLTGHPIGRIPVRPSPPAQILLRTETGDVLVNERGEHLTLGPTDGQ